MPDLRFRITFDSDWGIGTGRGEHGSLDRVSVTDDLGLPAIPAKSLTGMLRDSAEQAAFALDGGLNAGPWNERLVWLFGSQPATADPTTPADPPIPAALSVRPARLPDDVRAWIRAAADWPDRGRLSRSELTQACFVMRPGVMVSEETGAAADDTLRMEQWARGGLELVAEAHLETGGGAVPDEAAFLLLAAARNLRALGGRRRRGLGRCTVAVEDVEKGVGWDLDILARRLGLTALDPASRAGADAASSALAGAPPAGGGSTEHADPRPRAGQGEFVELTVTSSGGPYTPGCSYVLRVECLTPVRVTDAVISNRITSRDYLPGSLLFPVVARALGRDATRLIREGRVVVTDAFPTVGDRPTLPTPRPLQGVKGFESGGELHNGLTRYEAGRYAVGGYLTEPTGDDPDPVLAKVGKVRSAHAVIEDSVQRPTAAVGGLYVVEAIRAGTVLVGEVHLAEGALDVAELEGIRAVGGSKKDDYGQVRITVEEVIKTAGSPATPAEASRDRDGERRSPSQPDEQRSPSDAEGQPGCPRVTVWLVSDLLLTTEGRPDPSVLALGRELGKALGSDALVAVDTQFVAWRRIESWSAAWALPRPSLVGMQAGSVVQFALPEQVPDELAVRLAEVESSGIGLRRSEGFGRIRFDPAVLTRAAVRTRALTAADDDRPGAMPQPTIPPASSALTRAIEEKAWRARVDVSAAAAAQRGLTAVLPQEATPSQLGIVRSLVLALTDDPDTGRTQIDSWLASVESNPTRLEKWRPARQGEGSFLGWLGPIAGNGKVAKKLVEEVGRALDLDMTILPVGLHEYARCQLMLNAVRTSVRAIQAGQRERADLARPVQEVAP